MSAETTLQKVMSLLGMDKKSEPMIEVELAQKNTADGQAVFESDNFAVGENVFIVTPDGNIPAPEGEYALEDGTVISVDNNGVIAEVATMEEEVTEGEPVMAEEKPMMEKETEKMGNSSPKKTIESMTKETHYSQHEKEIADLKVQLSALQSENAELLDRLNKEEAPRTKFSPEASNQVEKIFKLGSKREETIQDRVFNQLF